MKFLKILLYPITIIYGIVVYLRNSFYDYNIFSSQEFDTPIISVGNITVGGTGKTPHIEYLVSILKGDFKVATLSRGYKRKTKDFQLASENSTVSEIGDEPKQIKHKFPEISVAVDRDRVSGINKLNEYHGEDEIGVILLDDAFQHRAVRPGLSILLIDYNRPLSEDHLLPYGRLRERPHQMRRANIIIITKSPAEIKPIERRIIEKELKIFPYQSLYFTTIKYGKFSPAVKGVKDFQPIEVNKKSQSILLVTGIANANPLIDHLEKYSDDIEHINFPDHHNFTDNDIEKIREKYNNLKREDKLIVTTEKDAVRIQDLSISKELASLPFYYIPIEVDFLYNDDEFFNKQITSYVRKNNRNNNLYSK